MLKSAKPVYMLHSLNGFTLTNTLYKGIMQTARI